MKRPIKLYGRPVLRKKAEEIKDFGEETQHLYQDLLDTLNESNGIGLAAPQIGISKRFFIIIVEGTDAKGEPILSEEPKVYINPELTLHPGDDVEYSEGCLSIPQLYLPVKRPSRMRIKAYDLNGNVFEEEADGWKARVIQHEYDHLDGILFIDRLEEGILPEIKSQLKEIKRLGSL